MRTAVQAALITQREPRQDRRRPRERPGPGGRGAQRRAPSQPGGAKTPQQVESELEMLKGLLAQQQEAQQQRQRAIAQQARSSSWPARAAVPAPAAAAVGTSAEARASTVRKPIAAELPGRHRRDTRRDS